jgi:hypothetical protein
MLEKNEATKQRIRERDERRRNQNLAQMEERIRSQHEVRQLRLQNNNNQALHRERLNSESGNRIQMIKSQRLAKTQHAKRTAAPNVVEEVLATNQRQEADLSSFLIQDHEKQPAPVDSDAKP